MGDYSENLAFNNSTAEQSRSKDYSCNGEYSAKGIGQEGLSQYLRYKMNNVSSLIGKTINFKAWTYSKFKLKIELHEYYNSSYHSYRTIIPANYNGLSNITLTVNNNTSILLFTVAHYEESSDVIFYTDNWELTVV